MESIIYIVIGIILMVFGITVTRKSSNKKDTKKEIDYKVNDAKLEQQQKDSEKKLLELQKKYENARKKNKDLTDEEIEGYWND